MKHFNLGRIRSGKMMSFGVISCAFIMTLTACDTYVIKAEDLMKDVTSNEVNTVPLDDAFTSVTADFSLELFKKTIADEDNAMISPLSVLLALGMVANGADGDTLSQMETVLGGGMKLEQLNEYLYSFMKSLVSEEKAKLKLANSIWVKEGFPVIKEFLQTNADYYQAAAYGAPFDGTTLDDINNWVNDNTEGLIKKIIDEIDPSSVMYLINTVLFDAEWEHKYEVEDVKPDVFTSILGEKQNVSLMSSNEGWYLRDDAGATGFIKPYVGQYQFVALLPNIGVDFHQYASSLTGSRFVSVLENAERTMVDAKLPKFKSEYSIGLNGALESLGIVDAFKDTADFSRLSSLETYINQVSHKTFIEVDEAGTKAGAVTGVDVSVTSVPPPGYSVILDRPFLYAIVDGNTNLPIFIGSMVAES
ncbi:MAG: serpin family protein [Erysipelotrichaceae bacterium]|jgi:serpin B|nr:serpin family protein [Erysipelotrichaceae bacterium]